MFYKILFWIAAVFFIILPFISAAQVPEFRGVWVATVDDIDWPPQGNFNSDSQKVAFIKLLDMHQRNGLNALIVQIRPSSDAFYPSPFEPWSEWLTGLQGRPPSPYYDPLEFMIAETHKRGMEFHAWINPYRAVFNINTTIVSATHITKLHPDWFLTYADKRYFDPGNPDARIYVTNIVRDIVHRYRVDGIHIDDYFYPYRVDGNDFPDQASYHLYGKKMYMDQWRRSNVDSIILLLSSVIKEENPRCKFGVSPFGVWRDKARDPVNGSDTKGTLTNYDDLYADILLWLKKGWVDYVAPQLYWEIGYKRADFDVLVDWWNNHCYGRQCYIGIGIYRAGSNTAWRDKTQLPRQIRAVRKHPNIQGMVFFRSSDLVQNPNGWSDSLRLNYFKVPAQIPGMNWLPSL